MNDIERHFGTVFRSDHHAVDDRIVEIDRHCVFQRRLFCLSISGIERVPVRGLQVAAVEQRDGVAAEAREAVNGGDGEDRNGSLFCAAQREHPKLGWTAGDIGNEKMMLSRDKPFDRCIAGRDDRLR